MPAPTFTTLRPEYAKLWATMGVSADKAKTLEIVARRVLNGKKRYQTVESKSGVPWFVVGLIHKMECDLNWNLNIAQGDPWNRRSVRVPAGRGPFASWEDAAIDALSIDGTDKVSDWSIERLCYELEKYNGFGSRAKGIHTPYLWSYTGHYTKGKYVADHVWDGNAVSQQAGAMPILKTMIGLDSSIAFDGHLAPLPRPPDIPTPGLDHIEPAPQPAPSGGFFAALLNSLFAIFRKKT